MPGLSTPSLGITNIAHALIIKVAEITFNSLSRDHGAAIRMAMASSTASLSTPSLGITRWFDEFDVSGCYNFQLPLSGSQAHIGASESEVGLMLSTPSLGITKRREAHRLRGPAFNSLSRDHMVICPVILLASNGFQLPLSGSLYALNRKIDAEEWAFNSLSRDH